MFLSVREVGRRYSVSVATIWRWTAKNEFPQPVKIGRGSTRWALESLQAFEKGRIKLDRTGASVD